MSITIYNGYRLPWMSLTELHEFMQRFRTKAREMARESFMRVVIEKATRQLDLHCRNPELGSDRPLPAAKGLIREELESLADKGYSTDLDFECSVTVIPLPEDRTLLAMIFFGRSEFRDLWEAQPEVEDFGYWNNTDDYPEGIETREQWKQREKVWERALKFGSSWKASWNGMNFSVTSTRPYCYYDWPSQEDVYKHLPSFEARIEDHTEDMLHEAFEEANPFDWGDSMTDYLKQFEDWKASKSGQDARAKYEEELRAVFSETVDLDDLKGRDADRYRW